MRSEHQNRRLISYINSLTKRYIYGSIFPELLRISKMHSLLSRMIKQGGDRATPIKELKKSFHHYANVFQKLGKVHKEINRSIMKNTY